MTQKIMSPYSPQSLSDLYYNNFKNSCKSPETFLSYNYKLSAYMKHMGYDTKDYALLVGVKDVKTIQQEIIDFIVYLKNKGYSYGSQHSYLHALLHFYNINLDVNLNHAKIKRFLSDDNDTTAFSSERVIEDKPYTRQQIQRLLEFSDLRTKVSILIMASAGLRLGALPLLRVGHLIPIKYDNNNQLNLYQITAYANSKKYHYHTFTTPECRKAIDDYINYRKQCGEHITDKSPLLRMEYDRTDIFKVANDIKTASKEAIKKSLSRVLYASGLRTPLVNNNNNNKGNLNNRRDIAMAHGFRKFFDTVCTTAGMNHDYIEWCEGHSLKGVKDSYFIPVADTEGIYRDILEGNDRCHGYLTAVDSLTINEENRLKSKVEKLESDKSQIEEMKHEIDSMRELIGKVMDNPPVRVPYENETMQQYMKRCGYPDSVMRRPPPPPAGSTTHH